MMILVTGASGLLGANFILESRSRQVDVIAINHHHSVRIPGVKVVQADLTNPAIVDKVVSSFRPQWIVNCASITNVDWCEAHPKETRDIHVNASLYLANAARKVGAKLAYISTDSVFDGAKDSDYYYKEEDPCVPLNIYAATKLAGEQVVQENLPSSLIVRTNIYGWNLQNKQSLAEWMFNELMAQNQILCFHDVFFTPILANDLADILFEMIGQELAGVYHVTGSLACSKFEFALKLADIFHLNRDLIRAISINDSPLQAPRPKNTPLSTSKITSELGGHMPDVLSGINRFKLLREMGFASLIKTWQEVEECQS